MSQSDAYFMRSAINIARRGLGTTWPNPSVGAVIVRPGKPSEVLARGWTMPGGRPHAERVALDKLSGQAKDCTLYVTLEPCSHVGQTQPCTDAIITSGIKRVVCSIEDPDSRVSGAGLAKLRAAGIEVECGILADEGRQLALGHIQRATQNRPLVQLKFAVGKDGLVPRGSGKPNWITGQEARAHGHLLRARTDAIMVGSGTLKADDPELTCRLPGMAHVSPVRIALSSKGQLDANSQLLNSHEIAPLWVVKRNEDSIDRVPEKLSEHYETIHVSSDPDQEVLNLESVLSELAKRGITRLLVEGGPTLANSFWDLGFVDEVYVYQGPENTGPDAIRPFDVRGIDIIEQDDLFEICNQRFIGNDVLRIYRRKQA